VGAQVAAGAAGDLPAAYRRLNAAYEQSLRYAEDVRHLYQRTQRAISQSLLGLANALEAKDPYTRGHSQRVSALGRQLAEAVGLSAREVDVIAQAGLLHDIGKIGVPESVLGKPGRLDPDEWELMRRHPVLGAQIVAPFEFFVAGSIIVRHHHERWDGSGYPDGLRRAAIPLGAVLSVAFGLVLERVLFRHFYDRDHLDQVLLTFGLIYIFEETRSILWGDDVHGVTVPELLADVPGLTREVALVNGSDFYGERYPFGALVPALATASFNVTGSGSKPGL